MGVPVNQVSEKPIIQSFMEVLRDADLEEYVREVLLCLGAPTIRGLKAASLLNLRRRGEDVYSLWNIRGTEWLRPFGVEWLLLNEGMASQNALVMIYRRNQLYLVTLIKTW